LRQVCSPHTYPSDGNPPRPGRNQAQVSTSISEMCLGSALIHPLLHWTVDQLPAPRIIGKVLRRDSLTPCPKSVPSGLTSRRQRNNCFRSFLFYRLNRFHPPGSRPCGFGPRRFVLSQNGREVDPCIQIWGRTVPV